METIDLLLTAAKPAIGAELHSSERADLDRVLAGLPSRPPDGLAAALGRLVDSTGADPVRAIEFDSALVELLCALDRFIGHRRTGNRADILAIAVHHLNLVDFHAGGYEPHDDMLSAPRMATECERVRRSLSASS